MGSRNRADLLTFIQSDDNSINEKPIDDMLRGIIDVVMPAVDFTVSAEATNVVTVTIQLKNAAGENLGLEKVLEIYMSDAAGGALTSTAPDGAVAATTGTVLVSHTAKTHLLVKTDANGTAVLTLTESGDLVRYLNAINQDGSIASSGALTWAA